MNPVPIKARTRPAVERTDWSTVGNDPTVESIHVSDPHFSHQPPVARSAEPDWYEAMARPWREIAKMQAEFSVGRDSRVPVVIAGDVFDRWNPPVELVNFVLKTLPPNAVAIPGQHDLPNHVYEDVRRSAYWTLVEAGKLVDLKPGEPLSFGSVRVHGFPWGHEVTPCEDVGGLALEVAVIHAMIWTRETGYPNAPEGSSLAGWKKRLLSYHVAHFGDNHKGFTWSKGGLTVHNGGTLLRRTRPERDYRPSVGLLMSDGSMRLWRLDCRKDAFLDEESLAKAVGGSLDVSEFMEELEALGDAGVDFEAAVDRALAEGKVGKRARRIVLEAMGR